VKARHKRTGKLYDVVTAALTRAAKGQWVDAVVYCDEEGDHYTRSVPSFREAFEIVDDEGAGMIDSMLEDEADDAADREGRDNGLGVGLTHATAGDLARMLLEEKAAKIRSLPFTADTVTGDRQAWMRENAARVVEGRELLVWRAEDMRPEVGLVAPVTANGSTVGGVMREQQKRIRELEALLLEEQQMRASYGERLARIDAGPPDRPQTVMMVDITARERITEMAARLSRLETTVQRIQDRPGRT
jgi:hypothetical protein